VAAPTWVKNGTRLTKSGGGASSLAPTIACTIGNYIVAIFQFNISGAFTAIATPAGWTLLYSRTGSGAQTYRPQIAAFGKVAAATTETCTITTVGTDTYGYGQLIEVSGVQSVDATATTSADNADATATTATATAAAALAVADSLVIAHCTAEAGFGGTSSFSSPATTGYTVIGTNADDSAVIGYDSSRKTVAVTTAPTATWTWTGASRYQWGIIVLSGTSGGGGTITGTSTAGVPLGGSASGTVAVGGQTIQALPLGGSAAGAVAVGGASTRGLPLGGQIAGAVAVGATSTQNVPLQGSAAGSVSVGGTSTQALPLGGQIAGAVAIGGQSTRSLPLGGSIVVVATVQGVSVQALPLIAQATAQALISGTSARALPLGGQITGGSPTANADSNAPLPLGGTIVVTIAVQGSSVRALPLLGSAAAQALIQAISVSGLPLGGQITASALVQAITAALLPLNGSASGSVGVGGSSIAALPLGGQIAGVIGNVVVAVSIAALPLGGTIIGIVTNTPTKFPSRGQLRMAQFWDAMVARVSTPRMEEILGGAGRIYNPMDQPPDREGPQDRPWGRIHFIPRVNLWPQIDIPGDWKNVAWLASVQFNDFRAAGYRVDIGIEAAHGELLDLLDNWAPTQAEIDDLMVTVPVWRYSTPPVKAVYDSQRRLWISNAEYRAQAIPRNAGV
jgi:hypothetical protein